MGTIERPPFEAALMGYVRARAWLAIESDEIDRALVLERLDRALDKLIATPSGSIMDFGRKMQILEREYGLNAQPRHLAGLYADVLIALAPAFAIVADVIGAMPS